MCKRLCLLLCILCALALTALWALPYALAHHIEGSTATTSMTFGSVAHESPSEHSNVCDACHCNTPAILIFIHEIRQSNAQLWLFQLATSGYSRHLSSEAPPPRK